MFCSQCGKKVMDTMLFCPFCGSPIVIPDQEEKPVDAPPASEPVDEAPPVEEAVLVEEFVPLNLDIDWEKEDVDAQPSQEKSGFDEVDGPVDIVGEEAPAPAKSPAEEISELLGSQLHDEPVQLQGRVPNLTHVQSPRRKGSSPQRNMNTVAPARKFDPDDIFLDGGDQDDFDDYEEKAFDYEEPAEGSFFVQHIRGIVSLSLFAVVVVIVVGWMLSAAGQKSLAQANLAWNPSVYEELAYEAYELEQFAVAGSYYEKALARDKDNYDYANYAGISYYMANDIERAAEMGKQAVALDPTRMEAYQLLMTLYPDEATRPWAISSLLQKGYQITGDESLKFE